MENEKCMLDQLEQEKMETKKQIDEQSVLTVNRRQSDNKRMENETTQCIQKLGKS